MPTQLDNTPLTVASAAAVTLSFHELDEADRQHVSARYWQWSALFDHDPQARITQHPDSVLAETNGTAQPVVLCEASRGGQVVALGVLAPKTMTMRQAGGLGGSLPLRGYRLVGNRWLGEVDEVLQRELLAACDQFVNRQGGLFLLIEDLEQSDPLFAATQTLPNATLRLFSPTGWQERLKIEFPPQPADYWAKFSSKTRNTFRRKQKKIGESRLVRITQPGQVAEFLEVAHVISQHTWQSHKLGLRIRNDETEARLFTLLATRQALRSYLLFVNDRPAAFLIGTQFNGLFSYEEVGYDRDFAELSPGQVLLLHVLDDLLQDNPPRVFDFGGGDADYKRLFATTTSTSGNVWIVSSSWRGQAVLSYLRGCRLTNNLLRQIVGKLGLTTVLRQRIRGKHANLEGGSA